MRMDPIMRQRIREGRKTEHRIPVRAGDTSPVKPCRYKAGNAYAIGNLHVQVAAVRRQRLATITLEDAKREGWHELIQFRLDWLERYDRRWLDRKERLDDEVNDRFVSRFGAREVWVLTLTIDFDLYLTPAARPAGSELGYTDKPSKALRGELPAVHPDRVDDLSASREAQRKYTTAQLEREAAYYRLPVEDKIRLLKELETLGVDVSGPMREISRQADRGLRRALRRAA